MCQVWSYLSLAERMKLALLEKEAGRGLFNFSDYLYAIQPC